MIRDEGMLEQLLSTIRDFVKNELIPRENEVVEKDKIPDDIVQQMRELGLFGLTIPEEYGGLGITMEEEVRVAFELGQTSPAFRSLIGTNNGIGSSAILIDGTEEQKQKYLPRYASGEIIGSFCLTEPESGSDAASLKTSAVKDGDFYVLNGTKRFITNAPHAATFTVMARTNPEIKGSGGISAFLVEANTPGITLGKIDQKMGQKGSHTCDVIFENCRVPASALIGGVEGVGFKTAMKVLDKGRLHIGAYSVGVAERMLNDALHYAIERKQFGQPIANFQAIGFKLADMATQVEAAELLTFQAAYLKNNKMPLTKQGAFAKYYASEVAVHCGNEAMQIMGGYGYTREYPAEKFLRDARLMTVGEGTSEIQKVVISREILK